MQIRSAEFFRVETGSLESEISAKFLGLKITH